MKEIKKPLTEKGYRTLIGIVLIGLPLMVVPFFLPDGFPGIARIAAFFLIALTCIIVIVTNFNRLTEYEWRTTGQKIMENGFTVLEGVEQSRVMAACEREKYKKIDGGYYWKKQFIWKRLEFHHFFVRCVRCSKVEETVVAEFLRFDELDKAKAPTCPIWFLFCTDPVESDFQSLMEASKNLILAETMVIGCPGVLVLVDEQTGKAYYIPPMKFGAPLHKTGIKFMKKLVGAP